MSDFLFVYGTLKSVYKNQWSSFLQKHAINLGKAYISGELFKINYYPGAVYIPDSNKKVYGELYVSKRIDFILKNLDIYEECDIMSPLPHEYKKDIILTNFETFEIKAWTYLYNFNTEDLVQIPSGYF